MPKTKKLTIVSGNKPVVTISKKKKKVKVKLPALKAARVSGRGAYSISDVAKAVAKPFVDNTPSEGIINKAARYAGSKLGDLTGIPGVGDALGNASSWLARAFGFGAYTIRKNSLMGLSMTSNQYAKGNIPQFADNGSLTFAHREFVQDIVSYPNFNVQNFLINAGNPTLFPWLSKLASNFEEYEFLGLIFEFKSTSAVAVGSTNTGLGTLIMATDYDCIDSNFPSKQAMEICDFSTSGPPCADQIHPIECDPKQNVMRKYFIQNATTLDGYPDDPRFSVLGNFQIATSGVQASSTVGELWVSYHVKLSKPQIADVSSVQNNQWGHVQLHTVNAGSATLDSQSYYPVNGGISMYSYATDHAVFQVNNKLGIGTYMFGIRCISKNTGGSIQWSGAAPACGNGASLLTTFSTTGSGLNLAWGTTGANAWYVENGSTINTHTGMGLIAIVNFPAVGSNVNFQYAFDAANTTYTDIVFAPWNYPAISKPLSEKAQLKNQLNDIIKQLSVLKSPEPTVDVPSSKNELGGECNLARSRLEEHRPTCISISQNDISPLGADGRYIEVVRSYTDTNQLRKTA